MVEAAGGGVWSPDFRDLGASNVEEAAARGIRIVPWTVNEESDLNRVLDYGVDGIISDYPDRAAALIGRRGLQVRGLYLGA
jgi:glycerophosphoryl diester phosphodiesterase